MVTPNLTMPGFKGKMTRKDYTLSVLEAIDLFFMVPNQVDIEWNENNEMEKVTVNGFNCTFDIK